MTSSAGRTSTGSWHSARRAPRRATVRRHAGDHPRRAGPGRDAGLPTRVCATSSSPPSSTTTRRATRLRTRRSSSSRPIPCCAASGCSIVDEVWDSGTTIHAVTERVRQAGGDPDDRGPPLQAGALGRARPAGRPRRRDRALGRLPVQGRSAESGRALERRTTLMTDDHAARRHPEGCVHPRERRRPPRLVASAVRCARAGRSTT